MRNVRRSKRRRGQEQLKDNKKKRTTRKRSQLESTRLELGKANALRDRILQHKNVDGSLPHNLRQMFKTVQKQIVKLQTRLSTKKVTVADVSVRFFIVYVHAPHTLTTHTTHTNTGVQSAGGRI